MRWYERLDWLLARLVPERCAACERDLDTPGALFCNACDVEAAWGVEEHAVADLPCWAATSYRGPIADALKRFKFQGHPELARRLARSLAEQLTGRVELSGAHFVPVPLHPFRLVERGYNQSALLARYLARFTGGTSAPRALRRCVHTTQQSRSNRLTRLTNLEGAFVVRQQLTQRRVILVDDVVTTGATAGACVEALRTANVRPVAVVCIARTPE